MRCCVITERDEICSSCERPLKLGEKVLYIFTGVDRNEDYIYDYFCKDCAPMVAAIEIKDTAEALKEVLQENKVKE